MKHFFARHLTKIACVLCLSAVVVKFWFQQEAAFYVLLATMVMTCGYIYQLSSKLSKAKTALFNEKFPDDAVATLQAIIEKAAHQHHILNKVTEAVERIGDTDSISSDHVAIEGEVGKAIRNLESKLRTVKHDESMRTWMAQGITRIGEIRMNDLTLSEYGYKIIGELVKILGANQAAFYSMEGDVQDRHLELQATYAYSKRHDTSEKVIIELGSGLLGQCVVEREMIYKTNIPQNYIKITSGLGEALPSCLAMIPLVHREEVFGAIEIASLVAFETHQLEFIKKACESISLELSGFRAQEQTRKLLEQSQEEELRHNLAEMQKTQLEMIKKEEELNVQLLNTQKARAMAEMERSKNEAILEGCMDAVVSFNEAGTVEYFNKAAEEVFGYQREKIIGCAIERILNLRIEELNNGSFIIRNAQGNEVTIRTEINASAKNGDEISLLLTATRVKIEQHYLFTLFAQKVSVDLF